MSYDKLTVCRMEDITFEYNHNSAECFIRQGEHEIILSPREARDLMVAMQDGLTYVPSEKYRDE